MFSNQDIDYSLNRPCRTLSAVAPQSSKSTKRAHSSPGADDDGVDLGGEGTGGWGDDDDAYLEDDGDDGIVAPPSTLSRHRFLVGSATPSVSKLNDGDDFDENGASGKNNTNNFAGSTVEEDDEERINRLYLLQYHEESHELTQDTSWVHPTGEVWSAACHPTRGEWVVTCGGGSVFSASSLMGGEDGGEEEEDAAARSKDVPLTKFHTALWRIPDLNGRDDDDDDGFGLDESRQRSESDRLEQVVSIPHGQGLASPSSTGWEQRVGQILWNPLLAPSQSSGDAMYDLADASSKEGGGNLVTVGWDDKSPISLWDISSMSEAKEVWSTHQGDGTGGVASSRRQRSVMRKFATMNSALPRRASWDPNDTHVILATSGVDVVAHDMRSPGSAAGGVGAIRSAHRYGVADVHHNHSQPNVVATSGMDGVMKFWDVRVHLSDAAMDPLSSGGGIGGDGGAMPPPLLKAVRGGHTHWMTRATYNPFYDQLVLSGGSDGIANLWRISSCSSAPLLDLDDEEEDDGGGSRGGSLDEDGMDEENGDEEGDQLNDDDAYGKEAEKETPKNSGTNNQDIRVTRFECSDVAADVAWSASDPWVYATLSYDGAVVVHHVPSKEKYKILL